MRRHEITDEHWERIKGFLPGQAADPGVTAADNRLFVNAVLWIAKTGAPWRDLPERFGNWNSVWRRFDRWSAKGVWLRIFEELKDPDLEWLILDSTVIRAHQHAAGAGKKGGSDQALGRSRGGFGTKLHIAVDGLGNPVEFILTGGQEADINQGDALIEGQEFDTVIADKGYDGDKFVAAIEARGAAAVIPPKKNRIFKREYDKHLYKERNLAERLISRIKQYRRVATRYDKTARNFLGFVHVAAVMVLLL
ncbi:IS5 family transposase [Singulisphaera sp. Ch08]|uniref:IS5 family transposase n=1 Tax=Singulisphaera sp. Ch08 TaxID=3120278 RepID=A0AAU7CTS6_9BACT